MARQGAARAGLVEGVMAVLVVQEDWEIMQIEVL